MRHQRMKALLLAATAALTLTACGGEEAQPQETAGVAVQVESVSAGTISAENTVSGQVSAENSSTILIASAAKCTAVYFQAGDLVKAGDVLCTLELGSSLASYNAARISYNSAVQSYQDQKSILDKQVQLAQDNVTNTQALFEIGAASQRKSTIKRPWPAGIQHLPSWRPASRTPRAVWTSWTPLWRTWMPPATSSPPSLGP